MNFSSNMSYSESRSSSWRPSRAHDRPTSLCPRSRLSASYCTVPPVRALSLSQRRSRSCGPWSWYSFPVALLLLLPNRGRFPRSRCAARCCRQRIARCARRVLGQHVIQAADCRVLSGSDGYNSTASWTFTHPNQASIEPPCQPTTAPISSMKAGATFCYPLMMSRSSVDIDVPLFSASEIPLVWCAHRAREQAHRRYLQRRLLQALRAVVGGGRATTRQRTTLTRRRWAPRTSRALTAIADAAKRNTGQDGVAGNGSAVRPSVHA